MKEEPNAAKILLAAAVLLETKGWCKQVYAMDQRGRNRHPLSDKADAFCAFGALMRTASDVNPLGDPWESASLIEAQIVAINSPELVGDLGFLVRTNDERHRTKQDIIDLFRSTAKCLTETSDAP